MTTQDVMSRPEVNNYQEKISDRKTWKTSHFVCEKKNLKLKSLDVKNIALTLP